MFGEKEPSSAFFSSISFEKKNGATRYDGRWKRTSLRESFDRRAASMLAAGFALVSRSSKRLHGCLRFVELHLQSGFVMAESSDTMDMKEFQLHEKDTGSADVQVALVTQQDRAAYGTPEESRQRSFPRAAASNSLSPRAGASSII